MSEPRLPPQKTATPPATARGEARRQALIAAAAQLFLERGYEGASIGELVERVGGSKASIYQYFGSKESLFYEVIADGSERFLRELPIPDRADEDLVGTLHAIGRHYLSTVLQPTQCSWFRLLVSVLPRFPELAQRFYDITTAGSRGALARYLRLQCEAGRLHAAQPERLAGFYFELLRDRPHMRVLLGLQPFSADESVDEHLRGAIDLFLKGCMLQPRQDTPR